MKKRNFSLKRIMLGYGKDDKKILDLKSMASTLRQRIMGHSATGILMCIASIALLCLNPSAYIAWGGGLVMALVMIFFAARTYGAMSYGHIREFRGKVGLMEGTGFSKEALLATGARRIILNCDDGNRVGVLVTDRIFRRIKPGCPMTLWVHEKRLRLIGGGSRAIQDA